MRNWTDEEAELVATYGSCEFCGGPRSTRLERTETEATMLFVCAWCGREPSDNGVDLTRGDFTLSWGTGGVFRTEGLDA